MTTGPFRQNTNRPNSQATGLPMGVEELARSKAAPNLLGTGLAPGVEQQAKERRMNFVGPPAPNTVTNGINADGTSAKLPKPQPAVSPPAAGPAPAFMNASSPSDTPSSASRLGTGWAPNALSRGARAGASSGLGGPVPAGGSGKSRGQRTLERLARRGNVQAAGALFQAEQRGTERASDQAFTLNLDERRSQREQQSSVLDFQRRKEMDDRGFDQRTKLQEDGQSHELDVLQFQEGAKDRRSKEESDAKKGFTVQPLDPADPTKGSAVIRGNGELFNLIPGSKAKQGLREFPDGVVQFPGHSQPYRREETTAPFQGVPFRKPEPQVTFTPLDHLPPQKKLTKVSGEPVKDPITGKEKPGPAQSVLVDPATGKATPVVMEGDDKKNQGAPSWQSWLGGETKK